MRLLILFAYPWMHACLPPRALNHAPSFARSTDICLIARLLYAVMGMTDIDDKIIARALERGAGVRELARHYEADFMRDMDRLGVCDLSVSSPRFWLFFSWRWADDRLSCFVSLQ